VTVGVTQMLPRVSTGDRDAVLRQMRWCAAVQTLVNSGQTKYLNVQRTDLRQTFRLGRTTAADERSESSFSIPTGTLPWQPIFVGSILKLMGVAGGRRLVAQPGGLKLDFSLRLVS